MSCRRWLTRQIRMGTGRWASRNSWGSWRRPAFTEAQWHLFLGPCVPHFIVSWYLWRQQKIQVSSAGSFLCGMILFRSFKGVWEQIAAPLLGAGNDVYTALNPQITFLGPNSDPFLTQKNGFSLVKRWLKTRQCQCIAQCKSILGLCFWLGSTVNSFHDVFAGTSFLEPVLWGLSPPPFFRAFFKHKMKINCCNFPCVQFTWLWNLCRRKFSELLLRNAQRLQRGLDFK